MMTRRQALKTTPGFSRMRHAGILGTAALKRRPEQHGGCADGLFTLPPLPYALTRWTIYRRDDNAIHTTSIMGLRGKSEQSGGGLPRGWSEPSRLCLKT